jgi:general secretion pathway protein G
MKRGFTMIELIFVIVIIGILAVIAIPKLSATRDDAKVVTELQNLSTCINDAGSVYTAKGTEEVDSSSCGNLKCYTVKTGAKTDDGTIEVAGNGADKAKQYCKDSFKKAADRGLVSNVNGGKKEHKFGGSKIVE